MCSFRLSRPERDPRPAKKAYGYDPFAGSGDRFLAGIRNLIAEQRQREEQVMANVLSVGSGSVSAAPGGVV